jgi:hypothetical protein
MKNIFVLILSCFALSLFAQRPTSGGSKNDNRLDTIYRKAGSIVKAEEEVFIKTTDKGLINFKNRTAGNITVPNTLTSATIVTAGLSYLVETSTGDAYVFAVKPDVTGKTYSVPRWRTAGGTYADVAELTDGNLSTPSGAQWSGASWQDLAYNVTAGSFNAVRITASNVDRTNVFILRVMRDGAQIYSKTINPSIDFPNNTGYVSKTYNLGFDINVSDGRTYKIYATSGAASGILRFAEIDVLGEAQVARAVIKKADGTYKNPSNNAVTTITAQETVYNDLQNPSAQSIWVRNGTNYAYRQDFIGGKDFFRLDPELLDTDTFSYVISMNDFRKIAGKSISDSLKFLNAKYISIDSITNTIRIAASASNTRAASEKAVRELFDALKITGRTIGSSDEYATLPITSTETGAAVNGDVAWLSVNEIGTGTAIAPQYPKGLYVYNGATYNIAVPVSGDISQLTDVQAQNKASTVVGTTTGEQLFKVVDKIYSDSMSVDSSKIRAFSDLKYQNKIGTSTSGDIINMTRTDAELQTPERIGKAIKTLIGQNALSTWDASYAAYKQGASIEYVTRKGRIYRAAKTTDIPSNTDPETDDGTNWIKMTDDAILDSVKISQDSILIQYTKKGTGAYSEFRRDTIRFPKVDLSTYALKSELKTDSVRILQDTILTQYTKTGTGAYVEFRRDTIRPKAQLRDTIKTFTLTNDTLKINDGGVNKSLALGMKTDSMGISKDSIFVQYTKIGNGAFTEYKRDTIRAKGILPTYTALQRVGQTLGLTTALSTAGVAFTMPVTLQENDLIEIVENYNNNATEDHVHFIRAVAGRQFQSFQYPNTANALIVVFPSTLTNMVSIKGATNQYIKSIRIYRDAENGFVVPSGTTAKKVITVTLSGATFVDATTSKTFLEGAGEYQFRMIPPAGQLLTGVTATNGATVTLLNAQQGLFTVSQAINGGNTTVTPTTITGSSTGMGVVAQANAGVDVTYGTLRFRIPTSGNRSIQVTSTTGSNCVLQVQNIHVTGAAGTGLANVTANPTTPTYINSSWNFGSSGQYQQCNISDTTNGRFYEVIMEIGASYNNNTFSVKEF